MATFDSDVVYVYTEGTSNKFWRIQRKASIVYLTYGRIDGENPTRNVKRFGSDYAASQYVIKQTTSKWRKGYRLPTNPTLLPDFGEPLSSPVASATTAPPPVAGEITYDTETSARTLLADD